MPFTFSHTAATFLFYPWLMKKRLSSTGIILGCIAPDFEYYLRMKMQRDFGHHFWGIILFDVPLALIIALIFHSIIRNELIDHLPLALKKKFIDFKNIDWFYYLKIIF